MFMPIPTMWKMGRRYPEPIVVIFGQSQSVVAEFPMLQTIAQFIKEAEKFNGKPYEGEPINKPIMALSVECSIIFPDEKSADIFLENIRR